MQTAKQLSVTLVNKPGRLAAMLTALGKGKVNFRALSVMDSGDRGMIRFVPDDFATAKEVLDKNSIRYDATDVLLVEVPRQPGSFRKICKRLAAEHLNIDYAYYAFGAETGSKGAGMAVIRVNDLAKAQRVLSDRNGTVKSRLPVRRPVHAR